VSVQAWQPPRRIDAIDFWLRSRLLATAHALRGTLRPSARRRRAGCYALADAPVLAQCRTPLASTACGLAGLRGFRGVHGAHGVHGVHGVQEIAPGDVAALRAALQSTCIP
jgi:hypothetical protein